MTILKPILALLPLLLSACVTSDDDVSTSEEVTLSDAEIIAETTTESTSTWIDCENGIDYSVPIEAQYRIAPSDVGRYYSRPQTAPKRSSVRQQVQVGSMVNAPNVKSVSNKKNHEPSSNTVISKPQQAMKLSVENATSSQARPPQMLLCPDGSRVLNLSTCNIIPPIFGGSLADHHYHPWAAHLGIITKKAQVGESSNNFCGAAIVSNEWLLTAAHCVSSEFLQTAARKQTGDPNLKLDVVEIEVKMGRSDLRDSEILHRTIAEAKCHSGFDIVTLDNDIALLRLDSPIISFSDLRGPGNNNPTAYVRKGVLPSQDSGPLHQSSSQQQIKTVGWGLTDYYTSEVQSSPQLIEATMDVDPSSILSSSSQFSTLPNTDGTHGCYGDSGSPVTHLTGNPSNPDSNIIVGINSSISGHDSLSDCTGQVITTSFTRVANYRDVIDEVISQ